MNFLDKIKTDMYDAMKSGDKDKAGTLRTLLAKLKDRQINNRKDLTAVSYTHLRAHET